MMEDLETAGTAEEGVTVPKEDGVVAKREVGVE